MNRITNEEEFKIISDNLRRAFKVIGGHMPEWDNKQNDVQDKKSSIIYKIDDLEKLMSKDEYINADKHQRNYYIRRWFNHKWALCDEYLFAINENCTHNPNIYDKNYDVDIAGYKVDVKGSVVPKDLAAKNGVRYYLEHPEELSTWMYESQSRGKRFGIQNRLFVIHTSYRDPDRARFAFDSKRLIFSEMCRNIEQASKFTFTFGSSSCYSMMVFVMEEPDGVYYFIPGVTEVPLKTF